MDTHDSRTDNPAGFRLFIAVQIPEEVKQAIEKAQAQLKRAVPAGTVRWTTREQFHLTLKFLGNVEPGRAEPLAAAVGEVCRGFHRLRLRAQRVGFFPESRFPRVIWAGIDDQDQQLLPLQQAVEAAVLPFTAEPPDKKFSGHVTLGRVKGIKRPEAETLAKLAGSLAQTLLGEWTANEVEVMRSELSPKGAIYTSLAALPLGPLAEHVRELE